MAAGEVSAIDLSLITGAMQDPAPFIARLREEDPVHWLPGLDAWLVTRHEDVRRLFSDRRLTADQSAYERYVPPIGPEATRWLEKIPFRSSSSGAESLGRRLVQKALTPRAVTRLEDRCREVVDRFAEPLRGSTGVVELMDSFTAPVSATAIGRILGVPAKADDELRFRLLARRATRSIRPILSEKKRRQTHQATVEMCEYVLVLVRQRHHEPQADMISDLVAASDEDESVSDDDVVRVIAGLVSAGTGTTSLACTRALRSLFLHPDQLSLLRENRPLLSNGIEELLRFDSGLIVMPRYVREPFELRGRLLEKGRLVALSMMGANRDPSVFPEPDRLDVRRDTQDVMSFGHGHHYCIGVNIARLELHLMLDALLDILPPDASLLEDQIRWSTRGLMSQIGSLPVDFGG